MINIKAALNLMQSLTRLEWDKTEITTRSNPISFWTQLLINQWHTLQEGNYCHLGSNVSNFKQSNKKKNYSPLITVPNFSLTKKKRSSKWYTSMVKKSPRFDCRYRCRKRARRCNENQLRFILAGYPLRISNRQKTTLVFYFRLKGQPKNK